MSAVVIEFSEAFSDCLHRQDREKKEMALWLEGFGFQAISQLEKKQRCASFNHTLSSND
ncbi:MULTISPECIES: hypothetical protein [unclassified Endozoicomonas]|uniref:hypothetical protein n=1 Tax=unclassified Endozoicomonas TaxID=2644528 RepID=UPI003BB7D810